MHKSSRVMQVLLSMLLACLSLVAVADGIYKWVDENGKVHYGEKAPAKSSNAEMHFKPVIYESSPTPEHSNERTSTSEQNISDNQETVDQPDVQAVKEEPSIADKADQDQALIDQCKRDREDYCYKGIDEIKRQLEERKKAHEFAMKNIF